jgi:predicted phage terminase large subunit-like protein
MQNKSVWTPQPGPQQLAFQVYDKCDGMIYGGNAGGGKTAALLGLAAKYVDVCGYYAMIFRREEAQVTNSGGMWDGSYKIYNKIGVPKKGELVWEFPATKALDEFSSGLRSTVKFGHLNVAETSHFSHQGAEYAFIGFDELTHFTVDQWSYLLTRLRTTCGIKARWFATCNPDKNSWVRHFIDWWIDPETGVAIQERSGIIRYWGIVSEGLESKVVWGRTQQEVIDLLKNEYGDDEASEDDVQSFTFINARLEDNKYLGREYKAKLKTNRNPIERARLLYGNWNIDYSDYGVVLQRSWFKKANTEELLNEYGYFSYVWCMIDTAVTKKESSDYSVMMVFAKSSNNNNVYILELVRLKERLPDFIQIVKEKWDYWSDKLSSNYHATPSLIGIENTQAGISCADSLDDLGLPTSLITPKRDKYSRLSEVLGTIKKGIVHVPENATWVSPFFEECECFRADLKHVLMNNEKKPHDDMVDCLAYGLNKYYFDSMNVEVINNPDILSPQQEYMLELTYETAVENVNDMMMSL